MTNQEEHRMLIVKLINSQTAKLKSSLCDYSNAYIFVKGNITVNNIAADRAASNNTNKKVIKNLKIVFHLLTA